MNKKTLTAALAAVLILAGCSNGNKPAETTTAPAATTTAAVSETTASVTEAAAASETTTAASETTTAADAPEKTPMITVGNVTVYEEDTKTNDWDMPSIDYSIARVSTGTYFDSDTNPDFFVPDEFMYNGETVPLTGEREFRTGDTIGGLTVTEASTVFEPFINYDADGNEHKEWAVFSTDISFDGEITVTGIARYYFDEQYTIGAGDIHIIPDASYAGLPVPINLDCLHRELPGGFGFTDFDEKGGFDENEGWLDNVYGGNVCVYTDAPVLRCGNIKDDAYSSRTELYEIFDGGNANCTKKVEVTLSGLRISYSDQSGIRHCSAYIKDIKAID